MIFPGGTENGLEIWRSLRFCKEITLFSASSDVPNHAPFVFSRHYVVPPVSDGKWVEAVNELIGRLRIDYLYPANSFIIDALIEDGHRLGARAVMADPGVCSIARSKRRTHELFSGRLPVPRLYAAAEEVGAYPVFVKPDSGYGGQGAGIAYDRAHLDLLIQRDPGLLIFEHLPGSEFTVDCFSARGRLLFCRGRERKRIRMGTSMRGVPACEARNAGFREVAERILERLPLEGAWFFQMKEDGRGRLNLLEVEPRIAGTMALHRVRGINFPLLSIFLLEGHDISTLVNDCEVEIDRALVNRYRHALSYSSVYVDFDDTLVVHDRVNTQMAQFLFQEINRGTRLVLLSKSLPGGQDAALRRWRLQGLFDEVIWLDEGQSKADFIRPEGAIFIDDSFSQRREVHERHHIPTFDPSMLEMLIDERV